MEPGGQGKMEKSPGPEQPVRERNQAEEGTRLPGAAAPILILPDYSSPSSQRYQSLRAGSVPVKRWKTVHMFPCIRVCFYWQDAVRYSNSSPIAGVVYAWGSG